MSPRIEGEHFTCDDLAFWLRQARRFWPKKIPRITKQVLGGQSLEAFVKEIDENGIDEDAQQKIDQLTYLLSGKHLTYQDAAERHQVTGEEAELVGRARKPTVSRSSSSKSRSTGRRSSRRKGRQTGGEAVVEEQEENQAESGRGSRRSSRRSRTSGRSRQSSSRTRRSSRRSRRTSVAEAEISAEHDSDPEDKGKRGRRSRKSSRRSRTRK